MSTDPAAATASLECIQRWMQSVIMHPDGVVAGARSDAAREQIDLPPGRLEDVVTRSQRLSAVDRLQIYANAYVARLLECLREEYPALTHALGPEAFDGFALAYLRSNPSESHTLADLGSRFPQFLAATRLDLEADESDVADGSDVAGDATRGESAWFDFLVDLARLERAYAEVFDGPGAEREAPLKPDDVAAIPRENWADARFEMNPSLRLLSLESPVYEYVTAVRQRTDAAMPERSPTRLAVFRRDFVVRRVRLAEAEFALLSQLLARRPLAEALEAALAVSNDSPEQLAQSLRQWFQDWAASTFILRIA